MVIRRSTNEIQIIFSCFCSSFFSHYPIPKILFFQSFAASMNFYLLINFYLIHIGQPTMGEEHLSSFGYATGVNKCANQVPVRQFKCSNYPFTPSVSPISKKKFCYTNLYNIATIIHVVVKY